MDTVSNIQILSEEDLKKLANAIGNLRRRAGCQKRRRHAKKLPIADAVVLSDRAAGQRKCLITDTGEAGDQELVKHRVAVEVALPKCVSRQGLDP